MPDTASNNATVIVARPSDKTPGLPGDSSVTADLAALVEEAQRLADTLSDRAEWEQRERAAIYREVAREFYEHGVDVGYRKALDEIAAEQAEVNDRLTKKALAPTAEYLERIRFDPEHLTASRRCAEQITVAVLDGERLTERCGLFTRVHYQVRDDLVRCLGHRPEMFCREHQERDGCAYTAYMDRTRRPEFTGREAK
jgi:hypothetical protein